MAEPLNLLVIEDNETDLLLMERQLKQQGLSVRCRRVDCLEQLADAVEHGPWDVVVADVTLPRMDFLDGLNFVGAHLPDVPVIVVSGTIGEERAVALLKQGVSDFVLKDSPLRLASAIERSVKDAADRRDKRIADEGLHLLNAAMLAATQSLMITDRDGTIGWVNPAFTAITGYSSNEAIGRNSRDLVKSGTHPSDFYRDMWNTILAGRVWRGEMTNRRKDGHQYLEEQIITPVRDAAGEIAHFVSFKRDLTEERQLQARFLQAQKMESVGQMAGGLAHDFNNLITAINGTAELAGRRLREGDPLRMDLDQIREIGARAALLTRQLLAFSRRQILCPDVLDLHAVVTDMQDMLQRLLGEDIELKVIPSRGGGAVLADLGQIEQIVMNLAVNARDAMPDGGGLTISVDDVELDDTYTATHPAARPGPHVALTVSDSGEGMDAATQSRIFEPFFTTKEPGRGTGLGLATVYGIVKQSEGSIWVYSEPGNGTTFKIYLPRVQGSPAPEHSTTRPAPPTVSGTETILVVEDEEFLRDLARRMLELAGFTVLTARDGEEALMLLGRHDSPAQLVLTDVVMPGIGGRGLAEQLATSYPGVKILFTSGYTSDMVLRQELLDGVTHFLNKPYTMDSLTRKVREVLDA